MKGEFSPRSVEGDYSASLKQRRGFTWRVRAVTAEHLLDPTLFSCWAGASRRWGRSQGAHPALWELGDIVLRSQKQRQSFGDSDWFVGLHLLRSEPQISDCGRWSSQPRPSPHCIPLLLSATFGVLAWTSARNKSFGKLLRCKAVSASRSPPVSLVSSPEVNCRRIDSEFFTKKFLKWFRMKSPPVSMSASRCAEAISIPRRHRETIWDNV